MYTLNMKGVVVGVSENEYKGKKYGRCSLSDGSDVLTLSCDIELLPRLKDIVLKSGQFQFHLEGRNYNGRASLRIVGFDYAK